MPTTLVLRFPWGRLHANPWGRHINEGAVELPPSPWRLLRALYATWRTRVPDLDENVVHALLAALAVPPTFFVPPHVVAHTRHYYPDSTHTGLKPSVDRTLDAFAALDSELGVRWSIDLPADQRAALADLASAMPYLGRADSVCEGILDDAWEPHDGHEKWDELAAHAWAPVDVADEIPRTSAVTTLLAPELPLTLDALLARPIDVRRGGLLFPRGTRLLGYQLTTPASAPRPPRTVRHRPSPTAVRFSILQPAPPPATDALIYTDLLRQAALSKLGGLREGRENSLLGGKTADRQTMYSQHEHAHFLPLCSASRLTGLLVWTPEGFPDDELKALMAVTRLFSKINDRCRATVRVAAIGTVAEAGNELTTSSRRWVSATPYTPSRYPKRNADWLGFLRADVIRELGYRRLPGPAETTIVDAGWQDWRRCRPSVGRSSPQGRASKPSAFLRLRFDEPVIGPLALGHLSHFGLGLFVPEV